MNAAGIPARRERKLHEVLSQICGGRALVIGREKDGNEQLSSAQRLAPGRPAQRSSATVRSKSSSARANACSHRCGRSLSWALRARSTSLPTFENMAPVLTRLFTPLFAGLLVTFLGTLLLTGSGRRHRAEHAPRLRPAPRGGPRPSALLRLRPGPPLYSRRL